MTDNNFACQNLKKQAKCCAVLLSKVSLEDAPYTIVEATVSVRLESLVSGFEAVSFENIIADKSGASHLAEKSISTDFFPQIF